MLTAVHASGQNETSRQYRSRLGWKGHLLLLAMAMVMVCLPALASAADTYLFGPKRYDRTQGKPPVYTDTFNGCASPVQATLKVQNGSSKDSSLSSAVVSLNGVDIFSESDFKNQIQWLEKTITVKAGTNTLVTQLKSGGQKETPFLIVQVTGHGCGSGDTTPPVITVASPADGSWVTTSPVTITGSVNEAVSSVKINGVSATLSGTSFSGSAGLFEGSNTLTIQATDLAGNVGSKPLTLKLDTRAPVISISAPANGLYLNAKHTAVTGSIDDPTATVTVNGTSATITGATYNVPEITLNEGDNTITVIARDPAGNQTTATVTVIVDATLPVVTVSAPVNGSYTPTPQVTVTGSVNEPPASVTVNGRPATLSGNSFALANLPLAEGGNTLTVEAMDRAGNRGTATLTVNLDTVAPRITVTSPANGLMTANPQLAVTGSLSEAVVSITVNGNQIAPVGLDFSTALTLVEGNNTILLEATDRTGNKGTTIITVTLDSTPPAKPVLEAIATPTNNPVVTVRGRTETGSTVTLMNGAVTAGTAVADASGQFSFTGIVLHEGENSFTVTAKDSFGNNSDPSAPVIVVLDTTAPQMAVISPVDRSILNTPQISVTGTIDDPTATVTVNGLAARTAGTAWTLDGFALQEGNNTLLIEARDAAGNKGSATLTVTLDTVSPVFTITAPMDGSYFRTPVIAVAGSVSETVPGVTVNGRAASVIGKNFSLSDLALNEGVNLIQLATQDSAGNPGSATVSVILDTVAPVVTFSFPTGNALLRTPQVTVSGTVSEPVQSLIVNGQPVTVAGLQFSTLVTLNEGQGDIGATAIDRAGNSGTTTIHVTIDSVPPTAPILDAPPTPTNNPAVVIAGRSEAGSEVTLNRDGILIGTVTADVTGRFSFPPMTLLEGANGFSARARDAAGNVSLPSLPLTIILDTAAPKVKMLAPADKLFLNAATVTVSGSIDDPTSSVVVNGVAATVTGATFTVDIPLQEGVNPLVAVATDPAGNSSRDEISVTRDSAVPRVEITAPVAATITNIPAVTVTGTVSKTDTTVTVNGQPATVTGSGFSLADLFLAEGNNTITVEATDRAGNKGTAFVVVTLDTVNPIIYLTAPANGLLTRNPQLTVSGTVSEPVTSLTINGQSVVVSSTSPFTSILTLVEGVNVITLAATDPAGNAGSATATVTLDSTPPVAPVLEALVTPVNIPAVTVRGSAEAGSTVTLTNNGTTIGSMVATAGLFSFPNVSLTEGENSFIAATVDAAGNTSAASAAVVVILDTHAPQVSVVSPADGVILNTPEITLKGTVDDPTAAVTVNGLPARNEDGNWTLEGFSLQEGNNTLLVEARDAAGNKGTAVLTVVLDTVDPVVSVTAPSDGLYTNLPQVTVTGTVNEPATAVTVNGVPATLNPLVSPAVGTAFTATVSLVEGANTITIVATDRAGNSGSATLQATLDTVAPQISVIGPAEGALLNNGQITFGGTMSETVVSVLVNGVAVPVNQTGNGYTLPVSLLEGGNTLTVTAIDRAGNSSTSTIHVTLDSTAPAAPALDPLVTPTRTTPVTVSGQTEALAMVRLFNNGMPIGILAADGAGRFTLPNVVLSEGANAFTASARDAAGNQGSPSAPLAVVLDTRPPVITITTPQPGVVVGTPQTLITGTVDEPLSSLTINGANVEVSSTSTFTSTLALAAGDNSALITATDLAGNVSSTTVVIRRDSTPPRITITAPLNGSLTNMPQIQVGGTVDDAEATLTVGGAPVSVINKAFSVGYLLTDGENSIPVKAVDKAGNEGVASVQVTLDAQPPVVSLSAPATATAGTDIQLAITATDNRGVTLVDLTADGGTLWSDSPNGAPSASQTVSLRLPPTLAVGATVTVRGRALDAAGNSAGATAVITVDKSADGPGFIQGKVLDDFRGLPLEGVQVSVVDSKGVRQNLVTPADGGWFFELASGPARVELVKGGFTTVHRDLAVRPGQRTVALDSRLTRIDGTVTVADAAGASAKSTPFKIQAASYTIEASIPAGSLSAQADVRLTPLSNQGLIAPLPLGWSPLVAADVRLLNPQTGELLDPQSLTTPVTMNLPLPKGLGDAPLSAHLARYDLANRTWLASGDVAIPAGAAAVTVPLAQPGQFALLVPDPAPAGPAAVADGNALTAAQLSSTDFSAITSAGRVVPQAAPPSIGLRAAGDLRLAVADGSLQSLVSGLVVNAHITENFNLTSGDKLQPTATVQDIVLYRRPCVTNIAGGATDGTAGLPALGAGAGGNELRTTFPVAPSRDFTIVDLLLGKISISITPPDTSGGVIVGSDGARLLQPDGTTVIIPPGALTGAAPVAITAIPEAGIAGLVGADFRLLRGVDISLGGQSLRNSATIAIPVLAGFDPALPVVVARKFDVKGGTRLKLVAVARQSGSIISSEAMVTTASGQLPAAGIAVSGQYLLLQAVAPIGYLTGRVTDAAAAPFAGIQLSVPGATLADLTGADGRYLMALATGTQTVTALDPARGDSASADAAIVPAGAKIVNLTVRMVPPRITDMSPANGAANVQPTVPVVITFSKAMDKNSVTAASLVVRDAAGTVVPGVTTWNAEATVATFYPADAFRQETAYTVTVAASVRDLQGYPLGQDGTSGFTVRRTTPPVMPAAGAISGTFPDADGYITVTGTQGSADPANTVLLINDTTGEIASVKPASNGSFTGRVRGQIGDEIKVVLMDYSGNQTTVSYITFKSPDGSYLVSAKGGTVEGEGGSVLDIPEGALAGPVVVKVTAVQEANLPTPVPGPGTFLSALNIDTGGIGFQKEVHLSIPVPAGFNPATPVFVTRPSEFTNADGTVEQVYEIIDSTKIINGRITTASPPFDGITGIGSYVFTAFPEVTVGIVSGYTYQEMNDLLGYQVPLDGMTSTATPDSSGTLVYTYDRPVSRAIVRNTSAWNYVSYTSTKGFFAGFTTLYENVGSPCRDYNLTAIHPLTMKRVAITGNICEPPYNLERFNFKLAEKGTIPPDRTAPAISMKLDVVPGQPSDNRIVAGTTIAGTKLKLPVSIIDQAMASAMLTISYREQGGQGSTTPIVLTPPTTPVFHTFLVAEQANLYRYDYTAQFNPEPSLNYYTPTLPGYYTFTIDARDVAGNPSSRSLQLHVIQSGASLGTPLDGPPRVDAIFPENDSTDVMVTTQIVATFNEPVQNVESNYKLIDTTTGAIVPSSVITGIEGGRMQATLIPKGNLYFARKYKVVLSTGIKDTAVNPSSPSQPPVGDGLFAMEQEYVSYFTTKVPRAYDLSNGDQFSGGRDIDLYSFIDNDGNSKTYSYIMAGDKGWRIVDVTDPTLPSVIHSANTTCDSTVSANCRRTSSEFNFRSVAVHPDQNKALMAMTENIVFADGNQYGYIRIFDLANTPTATPPNTPGNPRVIGREKLAEAYSGIPGRLALWGDYAVVNTAGAGIQIVNTKQAIKNQSDGKASDGSSIAGSLDTEGQGYGSPNDLAIFNERSAVFTTNPGYLLTVDLNLPTDPTSVANNDPFLPVVISAYKPSGISFSRIGIATGYNYTDSNGTEKSINLAVTGSQQGKLYLLDLTDPSNPSILNPDNIPSATSVRDISVSKDAGLVYVTTYNSIQVFDIKDPVKPRLLNEITSLKDPNGATNADGTPVMIPIGETPAIVEKGGWVYLANMTKGVRTLDLDPVVLKLYCEDVEFPNVNNRFCTDYYPALGTKEIILLAFDETNHLIKDHELAKVYLISGTNINYLSSREVNNQIATVRNGVAKFYLNAQTTSNSELKFKFKIVRSSGVESYPEEFKYNVRHNGNVSIGDVINGSAVFTYDINPNHLGEYQSSASNDTGKRVYFLKEMLNQVVTRKRILDDPFNPGTKYIYKLLKENGQFDQDTYNQLIVFKYNFNINTNYNVGYYRPDLPSHYSNDKSIDSTSDIFRKLMKDYGQRQVGNMWLIGGTHYETSSSWLHKIVDKDMLYGELFSVNHNRINGTTGNTINDTGLYELYSNVVRPFNNSIITESERYAGINGDPFTLPTLMWTSRNGAGPDTHGAGMSYCFGCKNDINTFNSKVSVCAPPTTQAINNFESSTPYRGNLGYPGCAIGTGAQTWTGLTSSELDSREPFKARYWTGIDCSGFVLKTGTFAKDSFRGLVQTLSLWQSSCGFFYSGTVCKDHRDKTKKYPLKITDSPSGVTYLFKDMDKIHKGDLISYQNHITIVHSDNADCDEDGTCTYDIIHASGNEEICYSRKGSQDKCDFNRKVVKNTVNNRLRSNTLKNPIGYGRITLWQ